MKTSELKKKIKQFDKLRAEIRDAEEEAKQKTAYPKAKRLLGTFWAFHNSYSCPKDTEDYWWVYLRVDSVNRDGTFLVSQFQIDKYGKLSAEVSTIDWTRLESGWQQIRPDYYNSGFKPVMELISRIAPRT